MTDEYGILIDYEFCTGCHTCEVACKQEHNIPAGKNCGVQVLEIVHEFTGGKMDIVNFPVFTKRCVLCAPRVKKGLEPACVAHCMAGCLEFGSLDKLCKKMNKKRRMALVRP